MQKLITFLLDKLSVKDFVCLTVCVFDPIMGIYLMRLTPLKLEDSMEHYQKSLLSLHGAVMLMVLSAVLGRFLSVPAISIAAGRVVCSSALLLLLALISKQNLHLNRKQDYGVVILAGLILAVHWSTFFLSIQKSSVAMGTITFSAFPLFLTILEPLVFREIPSRKSIVCACILVVGVLITIPEFSGENQITAGALWGLVSSFSYAILSLFNRYLSRKYNALVVCLYEQATAAVVLFPAFFLLPCHWDAVSIAGIAVLGFVCTALAHCLYVHAQKHVKAQTAGIVSGMETVYGILYAMLLLGEYPTAREWLGGAVILFASLAPWIGSRE